MKIDSELTEKSAKNTQRWGKLTATIFRLNFLKSKMNVFHGQLKHLMGGSIMSLDIFINNNAHLLRKHSEMPITLII